MTSFAWILKQCNFIIDIYHLIYILTNLKQNEYSGFFLARDIISKWGMGVAKNDLSGEEGWIAPRGTSGHRLRLWVIRIFRMTDPAVVVPIWINYFRENTNEFHRRRMSNVAWEWSHFMDKLRLDLQINTLLNSSSGRFKIQLIFYWK